MTKVLMVLSSNDSMGEDGASCGSWLEELAASYFVFTDAGCEVVLASPKGGAAPIDAMSTEDPWLTKAGERFQTDSVAQEKLANTQSLENIDPDQFDAVYLVGGVATAWDFPDNNELTALVSSLYQANRPVAGVCHGVLGLTRATSSDGVPIIQGRTVTGVSNAEEKMTGFDKVVPVLPESRLRELGGRYRAAEPLQENVVSDGNVHTGQNPASAGPLAQAVLDQLYA